jgi:hypothetical protein
MTQTITAAQTGYRDLVIADQADSMASLLDEILAYQLAAGRAERTIERQKEMISELLAQVHHLETRERRRLQAKRAELEAAPKAAHS